MYQKERTKNQVKNQAKTSKDLGSLSHWIRHSVFLSLFRITIIYTTAWDISAIWLA